MEHKIYRVKSFRIIGDYKLVVKFNDNSSQTIDFKPILKGGLFEPLLELSLFNQVQIDPEVQTLVWSNGADFDPATLHDWPHHVEELSERAQKWTAQ
ncbi:MAG: DUF2442 domain-containing protein [Caldithrix sp.]|nr:MAG: DUF2442 domain-containing protein [Caldithrix sp.]